MMWWNDGWGWWWMMPLLMVAFWVAVAWLVVGLVRGRPVARPDGASERPESPEQVLAHRYARGELDDLAGDRQAVKPAPGRVKLGVPGRVMDGSPLVAPATEVPVVVFGRARLVVGNQLVVPDVGHRRALGGHEHEQLVARYRGLLGAWAKDQRSDVR